MCLVCLLCRFCLRGLRGQTGSGRQANLAPLSLQGLKDWRVCKFSQQRDNPSTYKKDISSYMSVHYSAVVCEDSDDNNQSILLSVKLEGRVRSKLSQVLTQ